MRWVGHLPRFATKSHGYCLYIHTSLHSAASGTATQRQRRSSTRAFVVEDLTEELYRTAVTDHGRLPPLARGFKWPPPPSRQPPAFEYRRKQQARHRLTLTHHVSLRDRRTHLWLVSKPLLLPGRKWTDLSVVGHGCPQSVQSHDASIGSGAALHNTAATPQPLQVAVGVGVGVGAQKAATNGSTASGNNTIKRRPLRVHLRTKLWCYASPKHQANDSGNAPNPDNTPWRLIPRMPQAAPPSDTGKSRLQAGEHTVD